MLARYVSGTLWLCHLASLRPLSPLACPPKAWRSRATSPTRVTNHAQHPANSFISCTYKVASAKFCSCNTCGKRGRGVGGLLLTKHPARTLVLSDLWEPKDLFSGRLRTFPLLSGLVARYRSRHRLSAEEISQLAFTACPLACISPNKPRARCCTGFGSLA